MKISKQLTDFLNTENLSHIRYEIKYHNLRVNLNNFRKFNSKVCVVLKSNHVICYGNQLVKHYV